MIGPVGEGEEFPTVPVLVAPEGGWPAFTAEAVPDGVNMALEEWAALSDVQRELIGKRCTGVRQS